MIDWWFAWHPLEDLRYRIWYPPQHAGIMLSPIDRARILDPAVPIEREELGRHPLRDGELRLRHGERRHQLPLAARTWASTWSRFNKVAATFAGGGGWAVTVNKCDESITAPAIMCHMFYNEPGGLRHRTRFWMGYRFNEAGKPELCLPPHVSVPAEAVQGLARHNVKEFTRFGEFLPRIYKELGPSLYC